MSLLCTLILSGPSHAHVDDLPEIRALLADGYIKEYCVPGSELATFEVTPAGLTHYYKDHDHE